MEAFEAILYELRDRVAWITLNRPESLNAINMKMREEMAEALSRIEEDPRVRALVITGAGRAFSSGADIGELSGALRGPASQLISRALYRRLERLTKPTIAAINGLALGGGLELALACDLRLAAKEAELGLVEGNLGIIPGGGGTQRLPRLVGVAKAKELIFFAKRITGEEAERIGLVNKAVPKERLRDEASSWAKELAEKAPVALAAAKHAINRVWEGVSLEDGLVHERDMANLVAETRDREEGLAAFRERRRPSFKGY